ncbi:hypothetical protein WR25_04158 [Diploscapter pachys]|uniref:DUF7808 domain-containing protein n=1 Tax=Diploscapter pachys TaxID=2018661 RepID=A0A2A2J4W1_9BILA|nr:hypothetical protein WR25_04158 [Diploscapter pachys]
MVCTQNKNPKDPKAKEQADCSLYLKESEDDPNPRKVPFNPCFEENVDNTVRTYCDTLCPDADTVYRIFVRPQNHKTCHSHLTYRLERREGRHLMWRSGK